MRKANSSLLAMVLLLGLGGCRSAEDSSAGPPALTASQEAQKWVSVATVSGSDWITITHVTSLLEKEGIAAFAEGSVLYGVCVPPGDYEEAWEVLRKDSAERGYWIALAGENDKEWREPADWQVSHPNALYAVSYTHLRAHET